MNKMLKKAVCLGVVLGSAMIFPVEAFAKDSNTEIEAINKRLDNQEKIINNLTYNQDPFYRINQSMNNMLRSFYFDFPGTSVQRFYFSSSDIGNNANIVDKKDKIEVSIELPGMTKEDIEISLKDRILTIKGEKKKEKDVKDDSYYLQERQYGSFSRSIRLPDNIREDKISSRLENGVLRIDIPKDEKAKPKEKKIPIN